MTTTQIKCIKCEGRGKLFGLMHIDNGKCYQCAGSGRIAVTSVTVRTAAKFQAACTIDNLVECGDRVLTVNPSYAQAQVKRAAESMLIVADTAWAKRLLAQLPSGLRAAVIAAGRELKAAA